MANPGKNSVPLEKVLLQMDLGRGLDERTRPEVGGDQSKLVTGLNNLIQYQAGGWEKRHGISRLTSGSVDELGNQVTLGRVVPSPDGVCFASTGVGTQSGHNLYHYHESSDSYRAKGNLSELGQKAYFVAASNATTRFTAESPRILACASNHTYEAVVYEGGPTGTVVAGSALLVIFEKQSGSQVARYSIPPAGPVAIAATVPDIAIAFVGPIDATKHRYLHIYSHDQNLGTLQFASLDATATGSVWPATGSTITYTSLAPTPGNFIYDIGAAGEYSVVVLGTGGLYARDTSGNEFTRAGTWHSVSIQSGNTTAYFLGTDGGTARTNVLQVDISNIGAAGSTFVDPTLSPVAGSGGTNHLAVSSDKIWWLAETTPAFGSTTLGTIAVYMATHNGTFPPSNFSLVGTIRGWKVEGKPWAFGSGVNDRSFVHLVKDVSDRLKPHIAVNLDDYLSLQRNTSAAATSTQHFKVSAVIEPYNGISSKQTAKCGRYKVYVHREVDGLLSYQTVSIPVSYGSVQRAAAVGVYQLLDKHEDRFYSTRFSQEALLGGAAVFAYDSCRPSELGIVDIPVTDIASVGAGALTGSYNYVTVYRYVDAMSNATYSRVYGPVSKTYAAENGSVTIHACHVTSKETGVAGDHQVIVELYRTTSGGTQYHLLATSQYGNSLNFVGGANYYTFTDNVLDATLETRAIMYRQPGTAGTALDRYPPPGGSILCAHKDRVFVTDPYGINVYYSSFYVDGEMPWFNPQFFLRCHGGTGPITGMASMDGRLFVFKRDAIFVIDGDGPPENGGTGMEFSPPAKITTEYGCITPWSIVLTNNGIMYRSARGIELLTRSLQVNWIGERVVNTVDAYDVTVGAVQDAEGLVRYYLSDAYYGGTSIEVVYDTTNDAWSTATYAGLSQILGAGVYTDGKTSRVAIAAGTSTWYINTSSKLDDGSYYGWSFETGWVRPSGPQGRFRLYDVLVLGKKHTDHKLKVSAAYDYGSYSQSRTWGPESLKETLEEVNFQPKKTQPVTFRVKVEEQAGGTLSTGEGVDLLGVCFVVSPKAGAQQVAEYKKG